MRYSVAALVVFALVASACSTNTKVSGTAASDGFPAPSKDFVWDVAARALEEQGMQPDSESSSKQTWTLVTHWKFSMQPFSGQGFRQQATVEILDVKGRPGYYYTETQVKRQINDNVATPSSVAAAKWGDEMRCAELETLISRRIEMYFLPMGVSDQFKKEYGVDDPSYRIGCDQIERPKEATPQAGPLPWGAPPPPTEGEPSYYGR